MEVLKSHKQIIHEKQYYKRRVTCEICGKEVTAVGIQRHRATHTAVKSNRSSDDAQCDICFYWFRTTEAMENHKKEVHTIAFVEHEQLPSNTNEEVNELNCADYENLMPNCDVMLMKSEMVESLLPENTCTETRSEDNIDYIEIGVKKRAGRPRKIVNKGHLVFDHDFN